MERPHKEELTKLKADYDQLEAHIRNLNPEITLHSMLLTLRPDKFVDSLCKKPPGNMNELCERAKGYIQMEEMSGSQNEVRQVEQKRDKCEVNTKANLHKSNKRHKLDKH
ncbi:hypothetical protein JHK85_043754 [Glycine max]|nr:hypothetical protein JHK85_043754 [Glycine max]